MKKICLVISLLAVLSCAHPRAAVVATPGMPDSFEGCVAAGFEIIRSHPMRCVTPQGMVFFKEQAGKTPRGKACKDLCGDGICQQIVCMGETCPCPETPIACPNDCIAG